MKTNTIYIEIIFIINYNKLESKKYNYKNK